MEAKPYLREISLKRELDGLSFHFLNNHRKMVDTLMRND